MLHVSITVQLGRFAWKIQGCIVKTANTETELDLFPDMLRTFGLLINPINAVFTFTARPG